MMGIITYPVGGHKETTLKSAIIQGVNKVILVDENESYKNLFSKFRLITDVRPILKDDVSYVGVLLLLSYLICNRNWRLYNFAYGKN